MSLPVVRLQKFLADAGVASRRAGEQIILAGRVSINGQPVCRLGTKIDPVHDEVTVDGRPVERSAREFKLLQFLTGHPGRVYSRDQLLDRVWGDEAFVEPRTVDVHISRLRGAIEPDPSNPQYILTVRGIGYRFTGE